MIQVAIVENDLEISQSLADLIRTENDFVLVKSFPDADSFINSFMDLNVDVVLMDIELQG